MRIARHRRRRVHRLASVPSIGRRTVTTSSASTTYPTASSRTWRTYPGALRRGGSPGRGSVRAAAAGCDVIYHQGAMRSVPRSIAQPERDHGRERPWHAQRAARGTGGAGRRRVRVLVVGLRRPDHLPASARTWRRSFGRPYAASKLAGEAYCRSWWLSFGVPTVSLRYFNVYGPGQDPANEYAAVVPRFVMACLTWTPARGPRRRRAVSRLHVHRRRRRGEPAWPARPPRRLAAVC